MVVETNRLIAIIVLVGGTVSLFAMYFGWLENHDRAVEAASKQYVECVREQYQTTPSAYVAEHGRYPTCPMPLAHE